jgi:rhodanese-related sulfurtransferase
MITNEIITETQIVKDVFPLLAQELITKGGEDVVILDVCKPKEFEVAHIKGAINIDYFSKLFKSRLDTLDKDKTYFVYCRLGARSKHAQKIMKALGFTKVYNIVGGTLLWEEEGLPFATGRGPSKWVACPFSITFILSMKVRRAFKFVYGVSASLLKPIFSGGSVIEKGGGSHV